MSRPDKVREGLAGYYLLCAWRSRSSDLASLPTGDMRTGRARRTRMQI